MKRKFITNLVFLLILNLLIKPFWIFGIDRTVQNTVGAEEYGLYFSLFSFSILLNFVLDPGITNFNNRQIAQDNSILKDYFSAILPLKFILGIIYTLICITIGLILGYSSKQFHILFLLILNNFLLSLILYFRSNISGLHFFKTDSIVSVLDRFIMIIICSILLWGKTTDKIFKIEWFIYAQTISYTLTALIAFAIVLSHSGKVVLIFKPGYTIKILKDSFPYALLILLMSLINRIDSVMIERLLPDGKEQAGLYAQSFRILDASSMFALLFAGLLLPIFSKMIKQKQEIGQLLGLSFSMLIIPAIILVIISSFYGKEIINVLYNEHIEISSRIYSRLIISFLFISTTYIFGTLLTANSNLQHLNIFAGVTVIINVGLNLFLIPRYKAEGAAYANVLSQGFFAVSQVFITVSIFKLKINYILLARHFFFIILLIITGIFFIGLHIEWTTGLLLLILSGIIFAWFLKIFTLKGLINIFQYNQL